MRNMTPLLMAAALVGAAPLAAQDNTAANAAMAADPLATTDANAMVADPALSNGMATDPAMMGTTDPMATDPALAVPAQDDDDGFPWGVLGLLGLAGLIPRNRRTENDTRTSR